MKYVDLDRFRYLTGHGKEFALSVDDALEQGDRATGGLISEYITCLSRKDGGKLSRWRSGQLEIHFAPGFEAPYPPKYVAYDDESMLLGAERYGDGVVQEFHFVLSLVLWNGLKRTITTVPAASLLRGLWGAENHKYHLYSHAFVTDVNGHPIDGPREYIGVTRRGWRERWQQHLRDAKRGSHYLFHEAIRKYSDAQTVRHSVIGCYNTEAEVMAEEERMVGYETLNPRGLNMVPGGYAGIRFLHKAGLVKRGEHPTADEKHDIINRFFETAARKGIPNPFAAANWNNPDYAESVICGAPDRLKPEQIREARYLQSIGRSVEQITTEVGALNVAQVRRLLDGDTYSRVA